jgi:hypothetical protein
VILKMSCRYCGLPFEEHGRGKPESGLPVSQWIAVRPFAVCVPCWESLAPTRGEAEDLRRERLRKLLDAEGHRGGAE